MAPLANDDDAIKLLPLRFVNRHDLNALRIIDAVYELILDKRLARSRVATVSLPHFGEVCTDPLSPLERHKVIQVSDNFP
jgi:hypothetical protein